MAEPEDTPTSIPGIKSPAPENKRARPAPETKKPEDQNDGA